MNRIMTNTMLNDNCNEWMRLSRHDQYKHNMAVNHIISWCELNNNKHYKWTDIQKLTPSVYSWAIDIYNITSRNNRCRYTLHADEIGLYIS